MPSERNPSYNLTNAQLDDIVDRLLRGKYEKHRPVQPLEATRTGLLGAGNIRSYVVSRWGERSRWSTNTDALSAAGVTMRSNKLAERLQPLIQKAQTLESDELIWRVYDQRSYDTVCYAVGSRESARNWAWTLFGWTLPEGSGGVERLRADFVGSGGMIVASTRNMELAGNYSDRIKEHEARAARETAQAERLRAAVDSITGAAAHLASGATVG
jgi:hypothetical protein